MNCFEEYAGNRLFQDCADVINQLMMIVIAQPHKTPPNNTLLHSVMPLV